MHPGLPRPDQPAAISLNKNFRSRQEVTEGINFLFEQTMSRTVGEMDYRDGEQLQAGAVYPPAEGCGCEVHLVQKQKGEDSAREQEAEYIAGLIEEMIHSGYQVSESRGVRPVRPADICILLRSVKDKAGVLSPGAWKSGASAASGKTAAAICTAGRSRRCCRCSGRWTTPCWTSTWLLPCSRRWRLHPR